MLMRRWTRESDIVARFASNKLVALLPETDIHGAVMVRERILEAINSYHFQWESEPLPVSVSIGGAYAPQWVRSTATLWKERADLQLYRAKAEGRNRTCLEPTPVSVVSAEEKGLLFASSIFGEDLS